MFFVSLWYIVFYLVQRILAWYKHVSTIVKPKEIKQRKTSLNKIDFSTRENSYKKNKKIYTGLCDADKERIIEILKKVQVLSVKWNFEKAKSLIVEGLALDKFHKDLNLELACIYKKENKLSNASYIYKDLLDIYENDAEISKKLAFVYALESKLKISLKLYEEIHKKNKWDLEVVDMLCELSYNMKKYEKTLKYTSQYLKTKPRDVEKMFMRTESLEALEMFDEAKALYKKILQLQPYNAKAKQALWQV